MSTPISCEQAEEILEKGVQKPREVAQLIVHCALCEECRKKVAELYAKSHPKPSEN